MLKSLALAGARSPEKTTPMMTLKTRGSVLCALLMAVVLSACDPDAEKNSEPTPQDRTRGHVQGVVLRDDNVRLSGIEVRIVETGGKTTTDAQGKFSFQSLEPGRVTLAVAKEGYTDAQQEVEVEAGLTTAMSLTMDRIRTRVTGVVQLADGTPQADIEITLHLSRDMAPIQETSTDPWGRFTLDVPAGIYTFRASARGLRPYEEMLEVKQKPLSVTFTVQPVK